SVPWRRCASTYLSSKRWTTFIGGGRRRTRLRASAPKSAIRASQGRCNLSSESGPGQRSRSPLIFSPRRSHLSHVGEERPLGRDDAQRQGSAGLDDGLPIKLALGGVNERVRAEDDLQVGQRPLGQRER